LKRRSSRRRRPRQPATRTLAIGAIGLGLAVVAAVIMLVAPTLLDDLVATTRSLSFRSSSVGVVAGAELFEHVLVTDRAGWRFTGAFDAEPGDELALVDDAGLRLLTPATMAERQRFPLGFEVASKWKPSMRIALDGDRLVIVDTGGAVDDARVRDLEGDELWRYRPDVDIPARSLEPADLDGDGALEYYAASENTIARVDREGHEVWHAPFASGSIVAMAPRTSRGPAWIVGVGQGQVGIWDDAGTRLATLVLKDARPLSIVDWPEGRFLLTGTTALRAIDVDGQVTFERPGTYGRVTEAIGVSLSFASAPAVAFVTEGGNGDDRWRIQVVTRAGERLYEETASAPPHLLKTRGADGDDRLFVNGAGLLTALRPVAR
jgi:hypothetical protein